MKIVFALAMIMGAVWITYVFYPQSPFLSATNDQNASAVDGKSNLKHAYIPTEQLIDEIKKHFSINAYKSQLMEQQQKLRARLENVDLLERIVLEREIALQQVKIDNYNQNYNEKIDLLFNVYQSLKILKEAFSAQNYHAAQSALIKGNTSLAYELFSRVEFKERNAKAREAINRGAEAAFQRGNIAQDQLDYRKAYRHYRQAVRFNPYNVQYLLAAGRLAENIALYSNAINYYEAALHMQQKESGKTSNKLRPLWINLGNVWNSKGDTDKAIKYFEMALASDLKTFGENHENVAVDKNNLGWAWENKGKIDTAIEYYQQALTVYKSTLGLTHPRTLQVEENLEIATRLLDSDKGSRKLSE